MMDSWDQVVGLIGAQVGRRAEIVSHDRFNRVFLSQWRGPVFARSINLVGAEVEVPIWAQENQSRDPIRNQIWGQLWGIRGARS